MDIDALIKKAEELKSVSYESPTVDLWKNRTRNFISEKYGSEYVRMFNDTLHFGEIIMSEEHGQEMQAQCLSRAIELLNGLRDEPVRNPSSRTVIEASEQHVPPKQKPNFGNISISGGTVVFGDGNKITQVAVKELVDALAEEIQEKVPDSETKHGVLAKLKEITTNETFAAVSGALIGEVLKRVIKP